MSSSVIFNKKQYPRDFGLETTNLRRKVQEKKEYDHTLKDHNQDNQ